MALNDRIPEQTNSAGRSPIGAFFSVFVVGLFLGAVFDAGLHPNHITFETEPGTNRVNLAPRKNDVIDWATQTPDLKPGEDVTINFKGEYSPCTYQSPLQTCIISGTPGLYEYACDSKTPCTDPGLDPNTTTGSQTYEVLSNFTLNLLAPFRDIGILIHDYFPGPSQSPTPNSVGTVNGSANDDPHPVISCNSKTIVVDPEPDPVSTGETISWTAGPITNSFVIQMLPGACTNHPSGTIPAQPNATCTLKSTQSTYPYSIPYTITNGTGTISSASCPNSGSHFLQVIK